MKIIGKRRLLLGLFCISSGNHTICGDVHRVSQVLVRNDVADGESAVWGGLNVHAFIRSKRLSQHPEEEKRKRKKTYRSLFSLFLRRRRLIAAGKHAFWIEVPWNNVLVSYVVVDHTPPKTPNDKTKNHAHYCISLLRHQNKKVQAPPPATFFYRLHLLHVPR